MRYDWTVSIGGVDVSQWVKAGGTIDYGKQSAATSFQTPTATFNLFTPDENPSPAPGTWPTVNLGDEVLIHVTWDGITQHRRFTGKVQAIDYSLYTVGITAAGNTIDWNNAWSGYTYAITGMPIPVDTSIPIELETDRVERWVGLAGYTITTEGVSARKLRAVPANTTGSGLLDVLMRIADDCDGLLLEDRLGVVHYRTLNFTRPARYTIPAALVDSTSLDMSIERGDLFNAVTVFYGEPEPDTGNQRSVYAADSASITANGVHQTEMYTDIQYLSGATGRAEKFLARNGIHWQMYDVALLMKEATGAQAEAIWDLQENWSLRVTPLPAGCPISTYDGDLLGMTEVMHESDYRVILHLGPHLSFTAEEDTNVIWPEDSITGGTVTYVTDGERTYQVHKWTDIGTTTATVNNAVEVESVIVAGGGGGGNGWTTNGGQGGAGTMYDGPMDFTPGSVSITVGAGGAAQTNGTDSKVANLWCYGGGGGGGAYSNGNDGGSGGGQGGFGSHGGYRTGGSFDGGITSTTSGFYCNNAGGTGGYYGGGAGGIPTGRVSTITGASVTYATGGAGDTANTGNGGGAGGPYAGGGNGASGVVILRYRIA